LAHSVNFFFLVMLHNANAVNDAGCVNRTIEELLDCLRLTVSDSCGGEAGRWLYVFKSLIMLPAQHRIGCSSSLTGALYRLPNSTLLYTSLFTTKGSNLYTNTK